MQEQQVFSVSTALYGLGIILIPSAKHPSALAMEEDGRPRTSKLQRLIWTAAVAFAFLAIFQIQFSAHFRDARSDVPTNLLIALEISVVTGVSAKSIAVNAANNEAIE